MDGDQISGVFDLGEDFGSVSDLDFDCSFDLGTDLGFNLGCLKGTISWNKFAPSRVWYNNNMYLPPFIDDNPSLECIGYSSISGYSSDGFKLNEEEGLLDCIVDGYPDFSPAASSFCFGFVIVLTTPYG